MFQEEGSETKIKYHEDFDRYKKFISDNVESPGIISTFAQLNFEILGILPPTLESTLDDQAKDLHGDDDEAQLRMELWGEPGTPFFTCFRRL